MTYIVVCVWIVYHHPTELVLSNDYSDNESFGVCVRGKTEVDSYMFFVTDNGEIALFKSCSCI
jgi:hypothetical protein